MESKAERRMEGQGGVERPGTKKARKRHSGGREGQRIVGWHSIDVQHSLHRLVQLVELGLHVAEKGGAGHAERR